MPQAIDFSDGKLSLVSFLIDGFCFTFCAWGGIIFIEKRVRVNWNLSLCLKMNFAPERCLPCLKGGGPNDSLVEGFECAQMQYL